jgi:hypothetical protein
MTRLRVWASLVGSLILAATTVGCSVISGPCDVTIAGIQDTDIDGVGKPLPADAVILARPADIDPSAGHVLGEVDGVANVVLQLRPEAAARLRIHTTENIGHYLAIAVGGKVVAVPAIMAAIDKGDLQLSGAPDGPSIAVPLAGCATGAVPTD